MTNVNLKSWENNTDVNFKIYLHLQKTHDKLFKKFPTIGSMMIIYALTMFGTDYNYWGSTKEQLINTYQSFKDLYKTNSLSSIQRDILNSVLKNDNIFNQYTSEYKIDNEYISLSTPCSFSIIYILTHDSKFNTLKTQLKCKEISSTSHLNQQVNILQQQKSEMQDYQKNIQLQAVKLQDELNYCKKTKNDLQVLVNKCKDNKKKLKTLSITDIKTKIKDCDDEKLVLKNQLEELNQSNNKLNITFKQHTDKINDLQQKLNTCTTLQQKYDALVIDYETLKTKRLNASKMVDYNKLVQENEKLKQQIRELHANYAAVEKEVSRLQETISVNNITVQQIKDCFSKIK